MKVFSPAPMSIALSSAGPGYGYPLVPVDCSPGLLVDPYYPVVILDPGEKKTLLTIIMAWAVYIMYPTSQDLNPLSKGDYCRAFVQEICIHARLLLLLEEPRVCKSWYSDFNSYELFSST